jgi:hypothetical protein
VHCVESFVAGRLSEDVVALHHHDSRKRGDALKLHKIFVGWIVHVNQMHPRLRLAQIVEVLLELL